jgi:hypothetical protein
MADAASPNGGAGLGGRWAKPSSRVFWDSASGGEDNGEGGRRRRGAQALPQDLDEDDKDVESDHQHKTIRDKDAGEAGRDDEDVLEVEGWKERAGSEDDEKEDELEDREDGFLHGGLWR